MQCLLLLFSQSDCLIRIVAIYSYSLWQTVQIQISWLLQKPADLDLHCLQRQGTSGVQQDKGKLNTILVLKLREHSVNVSKIFWMSGKQCIPWVYTVCSCLSVKIFSRNIILREEGLNASNWTLLLQLLDQSTVIFLQI